MIPIAQPLLGADEYEAVLGVLKSGLMAQGAQVAAFERAFADLCQVKEAVAVSSGTAALHLALLAHGVGPGDEVITSPFSFAATGNTILLVGAKPVFVDIEADTYNLDPALVERAITPRTKAIMPVHLYGNPADMRQLVPLAQAHGLTLIEDACQAHLALVDGTPVGGFGTGCFSFYPTKNMTTGEGGIVTTNDPQIAERVRLWRSHGQSQRYVHVALGYNLRMNDIQGALGVVQVKKLADFNERRIQNAAYLTKRLKDHVQTPVVRPGHRHVYHQYTIRARGDRDQWIAQLNARGVGTGVHYPCPIHKQPYYVEQGFDTSLPVSEAAAQQVISLPVHPALTQDDLDRVAQEVIALCQ
ncbi:MAG: DegT/DnrJ/EryC1/StrS family aminotransferase [Ktedonobacterales bacterium]